MADRGRDAKRSSRNDCSRSKSRSRKELASRIKGLFKGTSRKKKSKTSSSASVGGASTAVSVHPLEDTKTVNTVLESPATAHSLQLVLLLMDPNTRRFELLQLEFDSVKAKVRDVIAQIPRSVTEAAIRDQKFVGVMDASGKKQEDKDRLVDFCSEKSVLVALPSGLSEQECTRLARPILSDGQVVSMLNKSGFDVSGWVAKEVSTGQSRTISTDPYVDVTKGKPSVFSLLVVSLLLVFVLGLAHKIISTPIEVGVPLAPGTWRSKCGLFGYIPKIPIDSIPQCDNAVLQVHDDGTVTVTGDDGQVDLLMTGGTCKKEGCVDGIVVDESGTVSIGGRKIWSALYYGKTRLDSLAPWPFAESPNIKVRTLNRVPATA